RTEKEDKIPEREKLTEREKGLFDKIKGLNETEKDVQESIKKEISLGSQESAKQKELFNSQEEQLYSIYNEMNQDEQKLFKSLNEKNKEDLDNHFADPGNKRDVKEKAYDELRESLPEDSVEKVGML